MITDLTVKQLHCGLKRKDFSAVDVAKAFISRIENEPYNAFVLKTPEFAIKAAEKADQIISSTQNFGPLVGVPFGAKDMFCTKNIRTTAGSKILENFIPQYESTVTQKMHDAGAVMLGKLNMDEFAMGSANINSCFGPVINPCTRKGDKNTKLVPGGSSGGSAAAVAAKLCPCSLGSDTGGSVRQPASFCGIVGLKPTYGRCSRWGMIAFASSLDQAGVLTRSIEDAAIVLQAICGYDPMDSTSSKVAPPDIYFQDSAKGLKIGIPTNQSLNIDRLKPEIKARWEDGAKKLLQAGAEIIEVPLNDLHYSLPAYYILSSAEAASNLARYDGIRYGKRIQSGKDVEETLKLTRGTLIGPEVKRRILIGNYILSHGYEKEYYRRAQKVRWMLKQNYLSAFKEVDAILTPTTPCDAFPIDSEIDPVVMYLNDVFTVSINLSGLPAVSVPAGKSSDGLPLGLQLIGNYYQEASMLNIARLLERQYDNL